MDFSSAEDAVYGQLEDDPDLLEELYQLENESTGSSRPSVTKPKKATTQVLAQPSSNKASSQQSNNKRKAPDQNFSLNIPSNLLKIEDDEVNDDALLSNDDTDDEDLLAELAGIVDHDHDIDAVVQSAKVSELAPPPVPKRKASSSAPPAIPERRSVQPVLPLANSALDKQLPAVPPNSVGSSSSSSSNNQVDTQLLDSLHHCKQYYQNELKKASDAQNTSTQRRLQRTLAKVAELQAKVQKGLSIDATTIPPYQPLQSNAEETDALESNANVAVPPPARPDSALEVEKPILNEKPDVQHQNFDSTGSISKQAESILNRRRDQYIANAKAAGLTKDREAVAKYLEVVYQFDGALAALREGAELSMEDIAEIPPSPPPYRKVASLLEDLEIRANKFQEMAAESKKAGEDAKFRMNKRMMTKIKEAIEEHKKGVMLDLAALPTPIGMAKLEPGAYGQTPPLQSAANDAAGGGDVKPKQRKAPLISQESLDIINSIPSEPATKQVPAVLKTEQQDQLKLILSRQLQLKKAAMQANKEGDIPAAKDYLRQAKSLDQMVEAARCGLPVKLQDIPQAPGDKQRLGSVSQRVGETGKSATLEKELLKQVKICQQSIAQFQQLGDAKSTLVYEALLTSTQTDLHALQTTIVDGSAAPKFKLVEVTLPVLELNPDVPDTNLDLKISKISNLKLPDGWTPSDCALFVCYNFPFPHESHQLGRTGIVKGTDCPEFTDVFRLNINRKSRQLLRVLKRSPLKLEVFQKGGFLRSDKLWAHADISLAELENGASIMRTVELLEGRRKTGGTVTVEVKINKPIGEGHGTSAIKKKWVKLI